MWTTANHGLCFGDVARVSPTGAFSCEPAPHGLLTPGRPTLFVKPFFWALPGQIIAFGVARGPIKTVDVTIFGITSRAKVAPLLSNNSVGGYAFAVPEDHRNVISSSEITAVVGRNRANAPVAYLR